MEQRFFSKVNRCKDKEFDLPKRSTHGSAGYDFYLPEDVEIPSHLQLFNMFETYKLVSASSIITPTVIKTGVKCYMQDDEVLMLYMRSSSPSKLGLVSANSVAVIDSDYYNNEDNEGEIGIIVYNLTPDPIYLKRGTKIAQGVITKFLKVDNDTTSEARTGGYGSTGE